MSALLLRMQAMECTVDDLWLGYVSLTGTGSCFELEAALHDALILPALDYQVLEHVLWEMEHLS